MRALFIADLHIRSKGPPSRIDDYVQTAFRKLEFVRDLAIEKAVDVVIILGDVFHFKEPSRTPFWLVNVLNDVLSTFPCPVRLCLGNHDLQASGLASLSRQPIASLMNMGHLIHDISFSVDGWEFFTYDYDPTNIEMMSDFIPYPSSSQSILLTHLDSHQLHGLAKFGYGFLINGHMHERIAPLKIGGSEIIQVPSLMRTVLPQSDTEKPAAVLFDSASGFTFIEVPHVPTAEVFRFEEGLINRESRKELDAFINSAGSLSLSSLSADKILEEMSDSIEPDVMAIVKEYINQI